MQKKLEGSESDYHLENVRFPSHDELRQNLTIEYKLLRTNRVEKLELIYIFLKLYSYVQNQIILKFPSQNSDKYICII